MCFVTDFALSLCKRSMLLAMLAVCLTTVTHSLIPSVTVGSTQLSVRIAPDAEACSPSGVWFSRNDPHKTDPIQVVADFAAPGCPQKPKTLFRASTAKYWKNDSLCLYDNNSLWYQQVPHGHGGVFGLGQQDPKPCDSIRWQGGVWVWCRNTSTACFHPTPPPPPAPLNWTVYDVPTTGVNFTSTNQALADMFAKGEAFARSNIKTFLTTVESGAVEVMVEGAEYHSAWIETQPMARD